MAKNIIGLDLSSIADGGLQEKLNNELARVIENILDPNTDPTVKREVSIKLVLKPNDQRNSVDTIMEVKSKLAPQVKLSTTILVGQNYETGEIHANELLSAMPGQTFFDNDAVLRTDTGQPIDEIEKEDNPAIIDFKKKVGN
ncbi:hypothetical protein HO831_00555 [Streptococcus suis]|uniref:Phage protein n=2 Tax=Streptococcus suis TaxID=1307 RepID=A0A0Z8ISA2_STRSU|nr:hypothetical protein [Streptococcus suis]QBX21101.1 hypothetical protein Javan553_0026 [Streptococcus phage Javan553]QBX21150.1 hypothetical protein Javan563_0031 [Streptococcus phage Javan563]QBX21270.1 hypothetical protein Javan567_0030 [Streptococcus phage Javan567]QBX21650.1 hypothetical protein Javan585_0024 [Streptococcus phage Javan585]QBX31023.1 hypothetical protein Javan590_0031 [Streptococcus phage Javan590]